MNFYCLGNTRWLSGILSYLHSFFINIILFSVASCCWTSWRAAAIKVVHLIFSSKIYIQITIREFMLQNKKKHFNSDLTRILLPTEVSHCHIEVMSLEAQKELVTSKVTFYSCKWETSLQWDQVALFHNISLRYLLLSNPLSPISTKTLSLIYNSKLHKCFYC